MATTLRTPEPTPARIPVAGRSLHRWLVGVPAVLIVATFAFFLAYANEGSTDWLRRAFVANVLAVIFAAIAAPAGLLDFLRIPRTHPSRPFAIAHASLNTITLLLFVVNLGVHADELSNAWPDRLGLDRIGFDPSLALKLTGAGALLTAVSGSLGFYMAHRLRVGEVVTTRGAATKTGRPRSNVI